MNKAKNTSQSAKRTLGRPKGSSTEETKARIMDSASALFSRYDYAEVNMRMIALEAGITSPAIYNHYRSKDELFTKTVLRMMGHTKSRLSEAADGVGDWKKRLGKMLMALGEDLTARPGTQILSSTAQITMARNPEKFVAIRKARSEIAELFRKLVRDAVKKGDLPQSINTEIAGDLLMAFSFNAMGAVSLHWEPRQHLNDILLSFKYLILSSHQADEDLRCSKHLAEPEADGLATVSNITARGS